MDRSHEVLIKKLHDFSLPLTFIQEEHERRIITAVIRKLAQLSSDALFRVYKCVRIDGTFALELKAHSGVVRRGSTPERILVDEVTKKGALSWCVDHGSSKTGFWVEKIKSSADRARLKNKFDGTEIGESYTDFIDDPDTVIAVPLKTSNSEVIGIIAVQFEDEAEVSQQFADLLVEISSEVTRIMRKSNETQSLTRNTTAAVEGFLDDILNLEMSPELLEPASNIGFIARPFSSEFNEIGSKVQKMLSDQGCIAVTYDPDRPGGIVVNEIMEQIKKSRFGIADITGSNPNVLMEVGVMIASGKKVLLLKKHGDDAKTPFNVSGHHAYVYRFENSNLEIKRPDENVFRSFDESMTRAVSNLLRD